MAGGVDVIARAGAGTTGASDAEKQGVADAKATSMGFLDTAFPNVKNVAGELERGFRFWGMVRFLALQKFRNLRSFNLLTSLNTSRLWSLSDPYENQTE